MWTLDICLDCDKCRLELDAQGCCGGPHKFQLTKKSWLMTSVWVVTDVTSNLMHLGLLQLNNQKNSVLHVPDLH